MANFTWTNAAGGNWSTASNWNPAGPPGNGDNIVLQTLGGAYTSIDNIPFIDGINLSIGNSVTLILAEGDTSVENINAFGTNSLFETEGTALVSIGNGLGGTYAVNGPTAILDIIGFNGVGTFDLFSGTASFGTNANLSAGTPSISRATAVASSRSSTRTTIRTAGRTARDRSSDHVGSSP